MKITVCIPVDPHDRFSKGALLGLVGETTSITVPGAASLDAVIVGARQKDMAHLALDIDVSDDFADLIDGLKIDGLSAG